MATDGIKISEMPELSEISGDEYVAVVDTENGKNVNKKLNITKIGGNSGVGQVDPNSNGTGEIFNSYEGEDVNKATKSCDHAEGCRNTASGGYSHAEGFSNTAGGMFSHVEGSRNTTTGASSHAEGSDNTTKNPYEHAEGTFNKSNTGTSSADRTLHSIGIGDADVARKNAVEVMSNGDVYILGIGGYDGTNYSSAQTLQEVISSLIS